MKQHIMEGSQKKYVSDVIGLFFADSYPADVERHVQEWLASEDRREEKEAALSHVWNTLEVTRSASAESSLIDVKKRLGINREPVRRKITLGGRLLRIAAVVIPLLVVAGVVFFNTGAPKDEVITVATAENEMTSISLPDGTVVHLNGGTTLSYPADIRDGDRRVELSGEAVFEVAHDDGRLFEVVTRHLTVNVTGTVFDIKAYGNEQSTLVTLAEGGVDVAMEGRELITLEPDNQLVLHNSSGTTEITEVDAESVMAWRSRSMEFSNATLEEIFHSIERAGIAEFNIDEKLNRVSDERYTVKFSSQENLGEILEVLEIISDEFTYRIEKDRVNIYSKE